MKAIELKQPQRIVFGTGCMSQMRDEYLASGMKKLFLLTADPILPLIHPTICGLEQEGVSVCVETKILGEPTVGDFKRILKEAQDFNFGEEFTDDIIHKILDSVDDDFHDGISILGGEPLDPKNAPDVLRLVKSFRDKYGYDKSIWVYTGYIFENLVDN